MIDATTLLPAIRDKEPDELTAGHGRQSVGHARASGAGAHELLAYREGVSLKESLIPDREARRILPSLHIVDVELDAVLTEKPLALTDILQSIEV